MQIVSASLYRFRFLEYSTRTTFKKNSYNLTSINMANRPVQKATSSQPHFLQFNNLACETAGGQVQFKHNIQCHITLWGFKYADILCYIAFAHKVLTLSLKVIFATDEWFAPAINLLKVGKVLCLYSGNINVFKLLENYLILIMLF